MTFEEMFVDLLRLTRPFGARPDIPLEAEDYFAALVAPFKDRESCLRHMAEVIPGMFRSLAARPDWIQDLDWQWFKGKPMVFVGSIDPPTGTFHDDARFYVFWSPEVGVTKCVIQVS